MTVGRTIIWGLGIRFFIVAKQSRTTSTLAAKFIRTLESRATGVSLGMSAASVNDAQTLFQEICALYICQGVRLRSGFFHAKSSHGFIWRFYFFLFHGMSGPRQF